jgi:hypothetical protein
MMIKNQKGLSLLEVMIATGILATAVIALMTWAGGVGMGLGNINNSSGLTNTMIQLETAFGSDDMNCKYNLKNIIYNSSNTSGMPIPALYFFNQDGSQAGATAIAEAGQPLPDAKGVTVASIKLKPSVLLSATRAIANIELVFNKQNGSGVQTSVRRLPVNLTLSGTNIDSCSTSPTYNLDLMNLYCEIQKDGYSHYDPTTKMCVDDSNVQWFTSPTPQTATCPTGYKVASKTGRGDVCQSIGSLYTLPPRTYADGTIDSDPWTIVNYTLDLPTSTCNFVFMSGADLSTITSSIKCVPQ